MEFLIQWVPRIISGILSLVDSTNLRNRVYNLEDEHEVMWTALDDIKRMYHDQPAGKFAERTLSKIKRTYGRDV